MHKCHSQSASVDFLFDMTLKSCLNLKICVSQWSMKMKLKKEDQAPEVISLFKHYFRWFVVARSFPTKCYYWLKLSQIQQPTSGFLGQGSKHFCHLASRCKALMAPEIKVESLKHLGITEDFLFNTDIKHITIISLIFTYIIRNTFSKKMQQVWIKQSCAISMLQLSWNFSTQHRRFLGCMPRWLRRWNSLGGAVSQKQHIQTSD